MSDSRAQLGVPTTTFTRPTHVRSTSASSINPFSDRSADLISANEKREQAAFVIEVRAPKAPPTTPGGMVTPAVELVKASLKALVADKQSHELGLYK
jgi:hypothetical protein